MADEMNTDERAKFESWASDEGRFPKAVERSGEGYKLAFASKSWTVWQARAALSPTAEDMATASAQGFRDGVASLSAAETEFSEAQIASVCMSYRHDFGLLGEADRKSMIWTARQWERAFAKEREFAAPALTQGTAIAAGAVYAELPEFDSGDEPIWDAVFKWKGATPGVDALTKANAVESAIIDQLRDFADRTHALRASHGQAPAQPTVPAAWKRRIDEAADAMSRIQAFNNLGDLETVSSRALAGLRSIQSTYILDATPSPQAAQQAPTGASEETLVFAIQVEKLLCEKLGRSWSASGISIQTLVDELAGRAQQAPAGATSTTAEQRRLIGVIADKIEDGSLFQSGIYSKKDLARFVRNMLGTTPQAAPAAPSTPASFQGRVERHSDQSVLVVFPSCRLASEFERSLLPASPTIEGESNG